MDRTKFRCHHRPPRLYSGAAADAKLGSAAMSTQRGVKMAAEYDLSDELCASDRDPPEDGVVYSRTR